MPEPHQPKPEQQPVEQPKEPALFDRVLRKLLATPPRPKKSAKPKRPN